MHLEIKKSTDYTFTWRKYSNSIQEIPSAATVTIVDNGGSAIVSAATVTIAADGTMTYTLTAALIPDWKKNYKATLSYTVNSVDKEDVILFDVVEVVLTNNVRDEDLFLYVGELRAKLFAKTAQTSSAGSTTTFVSTDLKADRRDWTGGFCEIYITDTIVHEALITAYAKATGTCTIDPAYTASIASGLTVRMRESYQADIDGAYERHVYQDVRNKIGIAGRYIDGNVVNNMITFKALEILCGSLVENKEDKWDLRERKFYKKYQAEYGKLNEPTDIDEDGNVSDTEDDERPNNNEVSIRR